MAASCSTAGTSRLQPAELRRGIGYVIQQSGLFPNRTIEDNIATVPLLIGWSKARARSRARDLMTLVGLDDDLARRYPYQLSGGQQQRVGVARALAADPPVLLMDEPFSAVDPIVRATLQDELIKLQAELHKTIVLVTHDVEEAIKVGDQVAIFRPGGRIAQVDAPERLLGAPADSYVENFLGFDRGIRRLSFLAASGLSLDDRAVVDAGHLGRDGGAGGPGGRGGLGCWSRMAGASRSAGRPATTWRRCPRARGRAGPAGALRAHVQRAHRLTAGRAGCHRAVPGGPGRRGGRRRPGDRRDLL